MDTMRRLLTLLWLWCCCFEGGIAWQPVHHHHRHHRRGVLLTPSRLQLGRRDAPSDDREEDADEMRRRHDVDHGILSSRTRRGEEEDSSSSFSALLPRAFTRGGIGGGTMAAKTVLTGLVVAVWCGGVSTTTTGSIITPSPPPAFAVEPFQSERYNIPTTTDASSSSSSLLSSKALTSSLLTLASTGDDQSKPQTALDEAWTLINKYYIDRTFQGQDWNAVRHRYQQALQRQPDGEMKLITEMVGSLQDKYSRVLTADQYAAIQKYDLIGVGATLMPDGDTRDITVGAPPIPGSAAARAGLQVGDVVEAVNGQPTAGRTAFDIIDQIAQEDVNADTITLTIRKKGVTNGDEATVDYTLARAFQKVKNPVQYKITERRDDGTVVGYVRIAEFNALVKPKLEEALRDLVQNMKANALVLDLRGNGGGAFQSAVEISSLFLDQRIATYVVDGTTAEIPFASAAHRVVVDPDAPLVLWMDGRTASASEVFAAALHDNCRATLAGQPSFGKGLIQAVYGLKNGAGLVLTVAKYVTPDHTEIQGVGLRPDVDGMVPQTLLPLPGLYASDTSAVDFDRARRQHLTMCVRPDPPSPTAKPNRAAPIVTDL